MRADERRGSSWNNRTKFRHEVQRFGRTVYAPELRPKNGRVDRVSIAFELFPAGKHYWFPVRPAALAAVPGPNRNRELFGSRIPFARSPRAVSVVKWRAGTYDTQLSMTNVTPRLLPHVWTAYPLALEFEPRFKLYHPKFQCGELTPWESTRSISRVAQTTI